MVYCIESCLTLEHMTSKASILIIMSFSCWYTENIVLKVSIFKALCNFRMKVGNAKCSAETATYCLQWYDSHFLLDHGSNSAGFSVISAASPNFMVLHNHCISDRCAMLYRNYWKWPPWCQFSTVFWENIHVNDWPPTTCQILTFYGICGMT